MVHVPGDESDQRTVLETASIGNGGVGRADAGLYLIVIYLVLFSGAPNWIPAAALNEKKEDI